ncbi:type I-G CRISPR-associated protein, Cas3-extension family [Streptomyces yokosukanensis]|uniref:type I-G CRISPR-associated protein, Cas3-extension family n=1 Tax=Streptomyces yokosukanensis TaxID=67386 RepID=UPI000829F81E|nr:hypothetical protein [Streptomyces yokosukanensis]
MTHHALELPALASNSPLGFLAALGIIQLTTPILDQPARLSWRGPDAPAVLHTHQPLTHQNLADLLHTQLPDDPAKEPLPLVPGILSLPRTGPSDALRMPIDTALHHLRSHAQAEREHNTPTAHWFAALVNQLSITPTEKNPGKARHPHGKQPALYTSSTPLFGRGGQMTLANNWIKAAEECRKDPTHLHAALTAWRRVDGYAGANLDHHSTGDAHMVSQGKPTQQGVPGATWLALHGFATFRLTGDSAYAQTTSWDRTTPNGALTWPIWQPPLTTTSITTLLEHPLVRTPSADPAKLHNLGVTAIYTAPRTRLPQADGPLQLSYRAYP